MFKPSRTTFRAARKTNQNLAGNCTGTCLKPTGTFLGTVQEPTVGESTLDLSPPERNFSNRPEPPFELPAKPTRTFRAARKTHRNHTSGIRIVSNQDGIKQQGLRRPCSRAPTAASSMCSSSSTTSTAAGFCRGHLQTLCGCRTNWRRVLTRVVARDFVGGISIIPSRSSCRTLDPLYCRHDAS